MGARLASYTFVRQTGLVAALAVVACAAGFAADAADAPRKAEVMHWWTSGGEAAAVKVFADQFGKAGGEWVDSAIAGGEAARAAAINRIVGGNPPTASQFNTGRQFDDLVGQDLLNTLDTEAEAGHWRSFLPPAFVEAASRNGHMYAVPVNVHGQNWMFYSKAVFAKAGIKDLPTTWDGFFAAMDKIKAAGLVPVAQGGQPWQEHILFATILQTVSPETYMKVFAERDAGAVKSPEFRKAVDVLGRIRDYVDPGSPNRNWNDATAMLITGKAGVQFMGDWAKGEFKAAGQVPDRDFGCVLGLDDTKLIIGGDVFVMPKSKDPEAQKSQDLLARTMLQPDTQVMFSQQKGSMPVRTDIDTSSLDACAKKGMGLLKDVKAQLPVPDMLLTADAMGGVQDVVTDFFNNRAVTADQMVERYAAAIKGAS